MNNKKNEDYTTETVALSIDDNRFIAGLKDFNLLTKIYL